LIELIDIHRSYGSDVVLEGISASFRNGEISVVLGQSGEGKSVLMKTIVGLDRPDRGKILFDGEDITVCSEDEFMRIRRKCCYNFQLPALLRAKTIFHNVALPLNWEGRAKVEYEKIVHEALEKVGLFEYRSRYPFELSYGMQKRVSFARSLVMNPDYIIFDEPTSGLDPVTSFKIYDLIKDFVNKYGKGAVVVTHDLDGASYLGGNINLLRGGKFIFKGTGKDFFSAGNPYFESFLVV